MRELSSQELNIVAGGADSSEGGPGIFAGLALVGVFATLWFAFVGLAVVATPFAMLQNLFSGNN